MGQNGYHRNSLFAGGHRKAKPEFWSKGCQRQVAVKVQRPGLADQVGQRPRERRSLEAVLVETCEGVRSLNSTAIGLDL